MKKTDNSTQSAVRSEGHLSKKCYVLMVAKSFPKTHPKAGKPTCFFRSIERGDKVHTIRCNYDLWSKRITEVNEGKAYVSLRYWKERPYASKQIEYKKLYSVGIQKAEFDGINNVSIDGKRFHGTTEFIANNDGLSFADFREWFRSTPKQAMAIIHFTNFRY